MRIPSNVLKAVDVRTLIAVWELDAQFCLDNTFAAYCAWPTSTSIVPSCINSNTRISVYKDRTDVNYRESLEGKSERFKKFSENFWFFLTNVTRERYIQHISLWVFANYKVVAVFRCSGCYDYYITDFKTFGECNRFICSEYTESRPPIDEVTYVNNKDLPYVRK
jgi:hypothetical protein